MDPQQDAPVGPEVGLVDPEVNARDHRGTHQQRQAEPVVSAGRLAQLAQAVTD